MRSGSAGRQLDQASRALAAVRSEHNAFLPQTAQLSAMLADAEQKAAEAGQLLIAMSEEVRRSSLRFLWINFAEHL